MTDRPDAPAREDDEVSLLGLVNALLRGRVTIAWCVLVAVVLVATVTLFSRRTWTATASFIPQGGKTTSGLSAIASQFGIAVPGEAAGESPSFYVDLLQSRAILGAVVDSGPVVASGDTAVRLVDYFETKGDSPPLRRDAAITHLAGDVSVSASPKTSVVTIEVSMHSPDLAAGVGARLLELVNGFNLATRRSRVRSERQFLAGRLAAVQTDLRTAEDTLERFLQRNRSLRDSPELQFQHDRLARAVAVQQTLYTNVVQAYEQAKIDEVRDTPVITVLEHPEPPVRPDSRGTVGKGIIAVLAGFIFGASITLIRQAAGGGPGSGGPEAETFRTLTADLAGDLRRPWRLLRPARRPRAGG